MLIDMIRSMRKDRRILNGKKNDRKNSKDVDDDDDI
jgi:hypothetical protein